jgi:hypothetical protein
VTPPARQHKKRQHANCLALEVPLLRTRRTRRTRSKIDWFKYWDEPAIAIMVGSCWCVLLKEGGTNQTNVLVVGVVVIMITQSYCICYGLQPFDD